MVFLTSSWILVFYTYFIRQVIISVQCNYTWKHYKSTYAMYSIEQNYFSEINQSEVMIYSSKTNIQLLVGKTIVLAFYRYHFLAYRPKIRRVIERTIHVQFYVIFPQDRVEYILVKINESQLNILWFATQSRNRNLTIGISTTSRQ